MNDKQPEPDVTGSEPYRRMPEGASLGGTDTGYVAETLDPGEGVNDWGVDADGD